MLAWTLALPHLSYPLQVPGMVLTGFGLGAAFAVALLVAVRLLARERVAADPAAASEALS